MSMDKLELNRAPHRALRTSIVLTVITSLLLSGTPHKDVLTGFGIGAALSIFSLLSLILLVPMQLRPRTTQGARIIGILMLAAKLPVYGFGVWLAVGTLKGSPIALVMGIALVPAVITLQTLGALINPNVNSDRKVAR